MTHVCYAVGWVAVLLLPLETSPSPRQVHPGQSSGIAADLFGGFFGLGLIVLLWVLLNLKPKRRKPYDGPND